MVVVLILHEFLMFWILSSAQTDYELLRNKALNKDEIFYSKINT